MRRSVRSQPCWWGPARGLLLAWSRRSGARPRGGGARPAWRPDAALVLPPSFSSAWFAWRTRARGASASRRGPGVAPDARPAAPDAGERHLAQEYLALGVGFGVAERRGRRRAARERADLDAARSAVQGTPAHDLAARSRCSGPEPVTVPRSAGAGALRRGRSAPRRARAGACCRCGGGASVATCEEVAAASVPRGSLAGRTGIGPMAALCAPASVAVCNDSGMAHLAAAVGAPTVAVFGSTSSAWTAPLGARVRVVQRAPVCSPCFARTCRIGYAASKRSASTMLVEAALEGGGMKLLIHGASSAARGGPAASRRDRARHAGPRRALAGLPGRLLARGEGVVRSGPGLVGIFSRARRGRGWGAAASPGSLFRGLARARARANPSRRPTSRPLGELVPLWTRWAWDSLHAGGVDRGAATLRRRPPCARR